MTGPTTTTTWTKTVEWWRRRVRNELGESAWREATGQDRRHHLRVLG